MKAVFAGFCLLMGIADMVWSYMAKDAAQQRLKSVQADIWLAAAIIIGAGGLP